VKKRRAVMAMATGRSLRAFIRANKPLYGPVSRRALLTAAGKATMCEQAGQWSRAAAMYRLARRCAGGHTFAAMMQAGMERCLDLARVNKKSHKA
jgi:hypothetical protein